MNKLAIFVEGHTELLFVDRLIRQLARENAVRIAHHEIRGGTTFRRTMRQIRADGPQEGQRHFIFIYDCGGDAAVKSRMVREYDNLARAGYQRIVCLRDVYPAFTYDQIPALERGLPYRVPTAPIRVDFILSIMEIEAWFLAEHSHLARIDPRITVANVILALHFDPANDDVQQRPTPADDLNDCYVIGEKNYAKGNAQVTIDSLDYGVIYLELAEKVPYLKRLCDVIVEFLNA